MGWEWFHLCSIVKTSNIWWCYFREVEIRSTFAKNKSRRKHWITEELTADRREDKWLRRGTLLFVNNTTLYMIPSLLTEDHMFFPPVEVQIFWYWFKDRLWNVVRVSKWNISMESYLKLTSYQVRYCWQLDLFQSLEDVSPLIHEASSVLTNWRGVAGFLWNCVWEGPYRVVKDTCWLWVSESLGPLVAQPALMGEVSPGVTGWWPADSVRTLPRVILKRATTPFWFGKASSAATTWENKKISADTRH